MKSIVRRGALAAGIAVAGVLATGAPAMAATSPVASSPTQWSAKIKQLPQLPAGCYKSAYPTLTWQPTACQTTSAIPFAPAANPHPSSPSPSSVGDGTDYSSVVTGTISQAVGTFANVSPNISETGQNQYGATHPNLFSLQLNSQFFSGSPACAGSVGGECQAWEQFVYSALSSQVFIQYWLINYNSVCPTGWDTYATDCYTNSPSTRLSSGRILAPQLAKTSMSASAVAGGNDENAVVVGNHQASMIVTPDSKVDLADFWNTTEWGVFGDGGGSAANFKKNTTIEPETTLTATGTLSCALEGFTGETNNLTLSATPSLGETASPTMGSLQTNVNPGGASCATSPGSDS